MKKEIMGRGFVLAGYVWLIHISEGYQNIIFAEISLWSFITSIIFIGIGYWVISPVFAEVEESESNGK